MHFVENEIFHVYNRGNNKQPIFFEDDNYLFFLKKVRKEWLPYCDILCYCLMPNHFHFMLVPNENGCDKVKSDNSLTHLQNLSKAIGKTLSSYTQAINKRNKTAGVLFQKKTKAKSLFQEFLQMSNFNLQDYVINCFHYIHLNPLQANLVNDLSQWPYSSWPDYYGLRNGSLCNKKLFMQMLDFSDQDFKLETPLKVDSRIVKFLF